MPWHDEAAGKLDAFGDPLDGGPKLLRGHDSLDALQLFPGIP
jgi:hypothetical protein